MRRTFTVEGPCVPWQRARANARGKFVRFFTAPSHESYADKVARYVLAECIGDCLPDPLLPFALVVTNHPGTRKDGKPRILLGDVDNFAKLVADALQDVLFKNDKQGKLILGVEGESVPGYGKQVIDIVWLPKEGSVAIATDATERLPTALELGGYSH